VARYLHSGGALPAFSDDEGAFCGKPELVLSEFTVKHQDQQNQGRM
jgi:hypothetical protein